jgi:hypothetical protein
MVHDRPTARELVQAVREFLERDVPATAEGRLRFHARVAVNALAIAEREMELGPAQDAAHRERLAELGVADDAELAAAIRAGLLDDRHDEVRVALIAAVRAKLEVADPSYLEDDV